ILLDNRHGLVANVCVTAATGTAEREAALLLLAEAPHATPFGADKTCDVASFVAALRGRGITPHVARKVKQSAIDDRTTRHAGYATSQQRRKLVEQVFGWMKTVGGLRKLRHRGGDLVDWIMTFTAAAYNPVRLRTLLATAECRHLFRNECSHRGRTGRGSPPPAHGGQCRDASHFFIGLLECLGVPRVPKVLMIAEFPFGAQYRPHDCILAFPVHVVAFAKMPLATEAKSFEQF